MTWDFAEGTFLSERTAGWKDAYEPPAKLIEEFGTLSLATGTVSRSSATSLPLPDNSAHLFVTDPPYYDAVPYAFLADYFYVWLRRGLATIHKEMKDLTAVPKDEEIVVDRPHELSHSTHDITYYERELTKAFAEGRRALRPDGVATIVFASKTTASWEAILKAVVDAGWIITGSWPIDTERERVSRHKVKRASPHLSISFAVRAKTPEHGAHRRNRRLARCVAGVAPPHPRMDAAPGRRRRRGRGRDLRLSRPGSGNLLPLLAVWKRPVARLSRSGIPGAGLGCRRQGSPHHDFHRRRHHRL